MSLSAIGRRLGLGSLLLAFWHRPVARVRDSWRNGGPLGQRRTELGRRAMEAAALTLPVPSTPARQAPLELHLLTGRRYWYQTAFCLWTLARQSGHPVAPTLYDDGTLENTHRDALVRLFPRARFEAKTDLLARLDEHLPASRFPTLRERWVNYPNLRKIIDPHIGRSGWKLVIDSDLLFFRRPDFLLAWLDRPGSPLHAVDCETSYGYSFPLMTELGGRPVADLVNVGLTGLNGDELDWDRLEHWCRGLLAREGAHYYLEQALVAMLVAGRRCAIAPAADYVTLPSSEEVHDCRAVMHHYVANSKRSYFRHNWREAMRRPATVVP